MKAGSRVLWVVGLLTVAEGGGADPYSVMHLRTNQQGEYVSDSYLDTTYRAIWWTGSDVLDDDEEPTDQNAWVFWDVSSVGFKMGVPSEDFPSQYTATGSIEDAIDAWDDVESSVLSLTYDGLDVYLANDPGDGVNVIFWASHSSLDTDDLNGFTLITTPTEGDDLGEFSDVDIVLNEKKRWTTGTSRCRPDTAGEDYVDTLDVQSVVTHELGHALGLGHATGENAMTPSQTWCADDGMKTKYEEPDDDNDGVPAQRIVADGDRDGYRYIYVGDKSVRHLFGRPSESEKVVAAGVPDESGVGLATVFPNPFNPEVTVAFELDRSASVSVRIYDELGQRVRVLAAEAERPAGSYQFVWDGLDQAGRSQASGTYFLVVSVDGTAESHKLTLLH